MVSKKSAKDNPDVQIVSLEELYDILDKHVEQFGLPMIHKLYEETKDPFKAVVATLLSARTTDKVTDKRLPFIFKRIDTYKDLYHISEKELAELLKPIGFYQNKAKLLKKFPSVLEKEFNGVIPSKLEDLIKLPGVGRKTANLVQSVVFDIPAICVDTHVHRLMNYIGYVKTKTPVDTEMVLRKKLPKHLWNRTNHIFVLLGQNDCGAGKVKSPDCILNKYRLEKKYLVK